MTQDERRSILAHQLCADNYEKQRHLIAAAARLPLIRTQNAGLEKVIEHTGVNQE